METAHRRTYLIGEANPSGGEPFDGPSGRRLANLAGVDLSELAVLFQCRNLRRAPAPVRGGLPARQARAAAARLANELFLQGADAVLCGGRVAAAMGHAAPPLEWRPIPGGGRAARLPHPSGRCRWYNDPANRAAAAGWLRDLVASERRGLDSAVARASGPGVVVTADRSYPPTEVLVASSKKRPPKTAPPRDWADRIIRRDNVDPRSLAANPANFRLHPPHQKAVLRDLLRRVGWVGDIMFNETTGRIVDGHCRVEIAVEDGEPLVPVAYVALSEEEEKLILASYDSTTGMALLDTGKLQELAGSLAALQLEPNLAHLMEDLRALGGAFDEVRAAAPAEPTEEQTWPSFSIRLPPKVEGECRRLLDLEQGDHPWQRFAAMLARCAAAWAGQDEKRAGQ